VLIARRIAGLGVLLARQLAKSGVRIELMDRSADEFSRTQNDSRKRKQER
jgi:short-subunit dehydrogenase